MIAIDGTNMSKVLADPDNDKFFDIDGYQHQFCAEHRRAHHRLQPLVDGHPDRCVGQQDRRHQQRLHTVDIRQVAHGLHPTRDAQSAIRTKAIADWDVIGAIADSGVGADEVVYISQVENDPNWAKTDDAVTAETVKTIKGTEPGYQGEAPELPRHLPGPGR